MMSNQPPPPPYSMSQPQPIGFEQPPPHLSSAPQPYSTAPQPYIAAPQPYNSAPQPYNAAPQPYNAIPPPLNAAPPPLNAAPIGATTYVYPSGVTHGTDPLLHQQGRINALNAQPRPYGGWRTSYRDRKVAYIIVGVVGLIIIVMFLVLYFTVFTKANKEFDEAKKRQEDFHNKYFSNW